MPLYKTLFFVSIMLCTQLDAQIIVPGKSGNHQIATDYNSCMEGVKDSAGVWIIPPVYDHLSYDDNGYIAAKGAKYGLIDYAGNIRIPITYDRLRKLYTWYNEDKYPDWCYVVVKNDLLGVVDTSNKIVVPIRYLEIQPYPDTIIGARAGKNTWFFYNFQSAGFEVPLKSERYPIRESQHRYSVAKKNIRGTKYGLVDDSGHAILPRKYDFIEGSDRTNVFRVVKNNKYGYCSRAGKFIWPLSFTFIRKRSRYFSVTSYVETHGVGPACTNGYCGLITAAGDTLLPFVYDQIMLCDRIHPYDERISNLWTVHQDDRVGLYDDKNGWIIPLECEHIISFDDFYSDHDSLRVELVIYLRNGKWGVMTTAGQHILAPEYEEMIAPAEDVRVFRKGDSLIALGLNNYSTLQNLAAQHYSDSAETDHDPFSAIGTIPDDHHFRIFKGREDVTAYYHPNHTHDLVWYKGYEQHFSEGSYYNFNVPDSIVLACAFYTQPITETVIQGIRAYAVDRMLKRSAGSSFPEFFFRPENQFFELATVSEYAKEDSVTYFVSGANDIFTSDGRLIASGDTLGWVTIGMHGNDGSIYFDTGLPGHGYSALDNDGNYLLPISKQPLGDFNANYSWRQRKDHWNEWYLAENSTGKNLLPKKTYSEQVFPLWDSITIISNEKSGTRIYNMNRRKYVTEIGYNTVKPLTPDGKIFAVKTCAGRMGVLHADGTWLIDTIWTAMAQQHHLQIVKTGWYYLSESDYLDYYRYSVFSNDTNSVVFDARTLSVHSASEYNEILWKECVSVITTDHLEKWSTDSVQRLYSEKNVSYYYLRVVDTAVFLPWHQKVVVDTLYGSLRNLTEEYSAMIGGEFFASLYYEHPCHYCMDRGVSVEPWIWTRGASSYTRYEQSFIGDSVISFSAVSLDFMSDSAQLFHEWFSTVVLFPDGPRNMLLDSLVDQRTDWRNFIINTVLDYVNTHTNIEGDCHNPTGLPLILRQSFLLTEEGLMLYPPGFKENNGQLHILIPWKDAGPFMRDDIKSKVTH